MALYTFKDTIAAPAGSSDLPAEALAINGTYIENIVDGYRTLNVSGRETMAQEVKEAEVGKHDGAFFQYRRYPTRDIVITYQILADSDTAYREAFIKLNSMLNFEEGQLIFNDEPDKYFIGTPTEVETPEPGLNNAVGEFTLHCDDPFKYSLTEKTVDMTTDSTGSYFACTYNGTHKAYPVFESTFYESDDETDDGGDCGFVAFMNEDNRVLQFGNPDEEIDEVLSKSTAVLNKTFRNITGWTVNSGNIGGTAWKKLGSIGVTQDGSDGKYRTNPTGYGSNTTTWHGPTLYKAWATSVTDWALSWSQRFCKGSGALKQSGVFGIYLYGGGKILAGIDIRTFSGDKTGEVRFILNGTVVKRFDRDVTYNNLNWGVKKTGGQSPSWGSYIKKQGAKFMFHVPGVTETFNRSELESTTITNCTMYFGQYKSQTAIARNGVWNVKLMKNYQVEIPNTFTTNDFLEVDCSDASVKLNDIDRQDLGALGNDWEQFCLEPGTNQIGVAWSDYAENAPEIVMKYREVFL